MDHSGSFTGIQNIQSIQHQDSLAKRKMSQQAAKRKFSSNLPSMPPSSPNPNARNASSHVPGKNRPSDISYNFEVIQEEDGLAEDETVRFGK